MPAQPFAPLHEAVPPRLYGGTERVVSFLTEELVAMGHNVTLFASGDSVTTAELEAVWPQALRLDPAVRDTTAPHMLLMEAARRRAAEFDIMHSHVDYWPFSVFSRQRTAAPSASSPAANVWTAETLHARASSSQVSNPTTGSAGASPSRRPLTPQARTSVVNRPANSAIALTSAFCSTQDTKAASAAPSAATSWTSSQASCRGSSRAGPLLGAAAS